MTRAPAEVGSAASSYEILAKLAMGGMAEIFLARGASSAGVERYVVLKRVLRHRASDAHFVRMFLDEARLAAQLQHPNIAQVYDIGKLGDSYFFTMEYVHGETVRTLLSRTHGLRRTIPISSVLSIVAGAAAGLHHAHDRKGIDGKPLGIVHRDVSPSNLMVSYEGTVKVVDFGVAKAEHRSTETQSGTVKGKITYMSPEQCKGGDMDRRSDLFSLGIVMWEMLTSERLFRRASDFENMQAIVSEQVPPPSTYRPEIPPDIDQLVMKLLAKSPADRYQTGDELHEAIEVAAVRTGSALSTASLGRYMRELFGQRPEPWIELRSNEAHPEAFTVTSEPIPGDLGISAASDSDMLAAIPQLSAHVMAQPLAQFAAPQPVALPVAAVPLPVQGFGQTGPIPMYPTSATPGMGIAQQSQSSPQYPVISAAQQKRYSNRSDTVGDPDKKRSLVLYIVAPAALIGVIIGIALAVSGGKKAAPTVTSKGLDIPHEAVADETPTPVETKPADPAPVVETKPAETKPANPPPVETKPVAQSETNAETKPAAQSETNVETKPAAQSETNAETKPAAQSETNAETKPDVKPATNIETKPDVNTAAKPDVKPAAKPDVKPAETKPVVDVAELYKDKKYADVVSACNHSSSLVAANSTTCTVAACKAHESAKAKRWFTKVVAAKQAGVVKECAGVLPSDAPAKPLSQEELCKRGDLMACQR